MMFFGWKPDGVQCRVHLRPCTFLWVPVVEQMELDRMWESSYLDRVLSVSGSVEGEDSVQKSVAGSLIDPSSE